MNVWFRAINQIRFTLRKMRVMGLYFLVIPELDLTNRGEKTRKIKIKFMIF